MSEGKKCFEKIQQRHHTLRAEMYRNFNRVLPFNELVSDRREKAAFLGFGEGTSIYDSSVVTGNVTVGKNVRIGPFTVLDGSGDLEIGDHCEISAGVQIYSHDPVSRTLSAGEKPIDKAGTKIGARCHIGSMSIITKGVNIGRCCVIEANSLVNRDIPDYSIAAGTPATVIGRGVLEESGEIRFDYHQNE